MSDNEERVPFERLLLADERKIHREIMAEFKEHEDWDPYDVPSWLQSMRNSTIMNVAAPPTGWPKVVFGAIFGVGAVLVALGWPTVACVWLAAWFALQLYGSTVIVGIFAQSIFEGARLRHLVLSARDELRQEDPAMALAVLEFLPEEGCICDRCLEARHARRGARDGAA